MLRLCFLLVKARSCVDVGLNFCVLLMRVDVVVGVEGD